MRKRPILAILTLFMTVCLSGLMYACNGDNPTPDNSTPPVSSDEVENRSYWIKVNQESVELLAGETFLLSAELYLGTTVVEGATFTWESKNTTISTVSQEGLVTALTDGETEITVKTIEYETVESSVSVIVNPLLTLDLSKQAVELSKIEFEGYQTTAEIAYEVKWNNQLVSDASIIVSTSNENVSAILSGENIVVTAKAVGSSVVTVEYEMNEKTVETYLNVSVVKPYLQSDETYLFSAGKKNTIDLRLLEATKEFSAETVQRVSSDSKEFPIISKTGKIVTISETSSLGYDGSIETPVTIECEDIRVGVTLKGYTHVIRTVEDFDNMKDFLEDTTVVATPDTGLTYCQKITGYYILANDIDFATTYPNGYNSPFSYQNIGYKSGGYSHGWMATFDGNGHTISNLKLIASNPWCASLFGIIASGGKVQNVAFKDCSLANNLFNSAFFANYVYGTIENVYLDVTLTTTTNNASGNSAFIGMANNQGLQSTDVATNISNVTVVANGFGAYDYVMKGTEAGLISITGQFVIIGANEDKLHPNYSTVTELERANTNINAYTSLERASQDNALTACGSATFTKNGGKPTIKWNGETIYEEEIIVELAQQLYSIDDATINLSGVTGTITGIKDASGNEISYTLDGTTATVSGDDVLNNVTPTSATGAIETITVYTSVATYKLPLKVCTDVIDSASEFDEMKKFLVLQTNSTTLYLIKGYYVLGGDIDFSKSYADGYASPFAVNSIGGNGGYHGWAATFDGNGHTISKLKLKGSAGIWQNSLFGIVAANTGKIMNVAFKECLMVDGLANSAFLANTVFGTIENVYLDVTMGTPYANNTNFVLLGIAKESGLNSAATISNVTVLAQNLGSQYVIGSPTNTIGVIKGSFVVIGATESQIYYGYSTIAALQTANANIKVGTTSATTLATCGSASFATANNVFTIKWNDKEIYSKTLAVNS